MNGKRNNFFLLGRKFRHSECYIHTVICRFFSSVLDVCGARMTYVCVRCSRNMCSHRQWMEMINIAHVCSYIGYIHSFDVWRIPHGERARKVGACNLSILSISTHTLTPHTYKYTCKHTSYAHTHTHTHTHITWCTCIQTFFSNITTKKKHCIVVRAYAFIW